MISLHEIKIAAYVALTLPGLLFASCSKKIDCCKVINMHVDLDVRSSSGLSIFDESLPKHLTQDSVQIFYYKNSRYELVKNTGYDAANGFLFLTTSGQTPAYTLRVMVSSFTDKNNESLTLVKYGSKKTDTLKTEIINNVIKTLWLNNLKIQQSGAPIVRIVK